MFELEQSFKPTLKRFDGGFSQGEGCAHFGVVVETSTFESFRRGAGFNFDGRNEADILFVTKRVAFSFIKTAVIQEDLGCFRYRGGEKVLRHARIFDVSRSDFYITG